MYILFFFFFNSLFVFFILFSDEPFGIFMIIFCSYLNYTHSHSLVCKKRVFMWIWWSYIMLFDMNSWSLLLFFITKKKKAVLLFLLFWMSKFFNLITSMPTILVHFYYFLSLRKNYVPNILTITCCTTGVFMSTATSFLCIVFMGFVWFTMPSLGCFLFFSVGDSKAVTWSKCVQCLDDSFLKCFGEACTSGRPTCGSWAQEIMGLVEGEKMDSSYFK